MKRALKLIIPVALAIAVAMAVPYLRAAGGCSCHAPLLAFGSILGCSKSEQPENFPPTVKSDDAVSVSGTALNDNTGKTEHRVTFVEIGSVNCIPCKMMRPIMKDVEEEFKGQVHVVFHDVWTPQGKQNAMKYGIRVIPTQVFLDAAGNEYYRHEGFFPKEELVKVLKTKGVR
jgi:thioredoxin 1